MTSRKPDTTGKKLASLAGLILSAEEHTGAMCIWTGKQRKVIRFSDVKAMAASLVNQAADKPKRKAKRGKT